MIRITDKTQPVKLYFNKLDERAYNDEHTCHLVLIGMGEQHYDMGEYSDLEQYNDFYVLSVDLSHVEDGEYKWIINDYEQGLMIIGDLTDYITAPDDVDTYIQDHVMIDNTNYKHFENANFQYIQYE